MAVQKVGRGETGVLAVTAFAESVPGQTDRPGAYTPADRDMPRPLWLLNPTPDDSVTVIYTDSADARWPDVCELLDRTLAAAIARFSNGLG